MAKKTTKKKATVESAPVILSDRPCIKVIGELKDSLISARAAGAPIMIDASQVEGIDAATLQLLVAFVNSIRERALAIEWTGSSDAFRGMADLCDLSRHLGLALEPPDTADVESADELCPVF
jgi:anti-anti-sigma regulatory factor